MKRLVPNIYKMDPADRARYKRSQKSLVEVVKLYDHFLRALHRTSNYNFLQDEIWRFTDTLAHSKKALELGSQDILDYVNSRAWGPARKRRGGEVLMGLLEWIGHYMEKGSPLE